MSLFNRTTVPAPVVQQRTPEVEVEEQDKAKREERKRIARARGRASTILTGLNEQVPGENVARRTLLGGVA